jgi:exosortase A
MSITSAPAPFLSAKELEQRQTSVAAGWTAPLLAAAISGLLVLYFFRQTIFSIVNIWNNSRTYSYGFIIVPIVVLLVWRTKERLRQLTPQFSYLGFLLFIASAGLWFAGNIADVQLVQHIAVVGMLECIVATFLGLAIVRVLAFPLLFLFFTVPVGDSLVPVLQRWTAAFAVNALRLSGIPAVQDGLVLSTPSGDWQVAEACSGIRYLLASIVIGTLVAGVAYRSWKRRIAFFLLSAALPIAANALRAYGIVLLAYLSGNALATGVDHVVYGFVFFSLLTVVLVVAAMRSYDPQAEGATEVLVTGKKSPQPLLSVAGVLLLVAGVTVSTASLAQSVWNRPVSASAGAIWQPSSGWSKSSGILHDANWAPEPSSAKSRELQTYVSGPQQVSLCVVRFPDSRRGVELINSVNIVGKSGDWIVLSSDVRPVIISGIPTHVTEYVIAHGTQRRVVWIWYAVGERVTSDPYQLRYLQAKNRLLASANNTALYALSTSSGSEPSAAIATLSEFVK